jgi:hypothetical protein
VCSSPASATCRRCSGCATPGSAQRTNWPGAGDTALELLAEELRLAHDALSEITGEFSADDLLGEIFAAFASASRVRWSRS